MRRNLFAGVVGEAMQGTRAMMPIAFAQRTKTLAKPPSMTDEECGSLDVFEDHQSHALISCWRMTWRERLSALFFGRVWLWVMSGTVTQPPVSLQVSRNIFKVTAK